MNRIFSALVLGICITFNLVGCNQIASSTNRTETLTNEVVKPSQITFMVDGTFLDDPSGQDALIRKYKELTNINLNIISVNHNAYNDQLNLALASDHVPDVVILDADSYAEYASLGLLADITSYWENSSAKASGRIDTEYMDMLYIDDILYGFTAQRGNGCITYLRQDWLNNLHFSVPTTYDEYLDVLRAFTFNDPDGNGLNDTYGTTAAGFIGNNAPYINYLPEFWQDAYPAIYQKEDGTWVDGFSEEACIRALTRLKAAYDEGIIDPETATNRTSSCRDKFCAGNVGAFTYWAGKWNHTLADSMKALHPNAKLVAIPPIKEVGTYIERNCPVLAITSACQNPEGVYKYLLDFMLDGDEGQMLFTYGAPDVHYTISDGNYILLSNPENVDSSSTSIYIDPLLSISSWIAQNPFIPLPNADALKSNNLFYTHSKPAPVPIAVANDSILNDQTTIAALRMATVTNIITGNTSIQDGMASYAKQVKPTMNKLLASLNNPAS